jgi:hypothetical protein
MSCYFFRDRFFALICSLALLLICTIPSFADTAPWNADAQGKFITSLCRLTTVVPLNGILGNSKTTPITNQTANRNSKFYLLLDDDSLYSNQPYQKEVKEIDRLGRAQDLKGLAQIADTIEQTWGHRADMRGYFALMDELTNVLRSYTFDNTDHFQQYELAQKYVLATLAHSDVPLDITARLLPRLIPEEELMLYKRPFSTAGWIQLRSARASLWLQTRQRLKQLVIPGYDLTSPIPMNNPINLQELKNPKYIAAREQEIQKNNKKLRGRNDQVLVRFQDNIFSPMAENEAVSYYSQAPYDMPELKRLLDTYVDDMATKQEILNQVAKNIAAASQK